MIDVSCAIIRHENKILIAQRGSEMRMPLKWEFPGGKIKAGENAEDSLIREIDEELSIKIEIGRALNPVIYHYPDFTIRLHPFICNYTDGEIKLLEHAQIQWVKLEELQAYDWAEADVGVVEQLMGGV